MIFAGTHAIFLITVGPRPAQMSERVPHDQRHAVSDAGSRHEIRSDLTRRRSDAAGKAACEMLELVDPRLDGLGQSGRSRCPSTRKPMACTWSQAAATGPGVAFA